MLTRGCIDDVTVVAGSPQNRRVIWTDEPLVVGGDFDFSLELQSKEPADVLLDVLNDADCDPVKMFSIGPRDELERLRTTIHQVEPSVTCVFSEHDMLEFLGPNVNKGTALSILCESIGEAHESVIAFGDNMNDFELLQVAGTGVAMDTAPAKLRAEANLVIRDIAEFLHDRLGEVQKTEATHV